MKAILTFLLLIPIAAYGHIPLGTYKLDVNFGEHQFVDYLEITNSVPDVSPWNNGPCFTSFYNPSFEITGSLSSPGLFTRPITGCFLVPDYKIEFQMTLDEGSGEKLYEFKGQVKYLENVSISDGKIFVEGNEVGTFSGYFEE